MKRTAIIGLGNPLLRDDGVGPAVARRLHAILADPRVDLHELAVGGIELMEVLSGYGRAVIVDATQTRNGKVGDFYRVDIHGSSPARDGGMTHNIGLFEGYAIARRLGLEMPERLSLYAVEVADPYTFSTEMTDAVRAAVPRVAERILHEEFTPR